MKKRKNIALFIGILDTEFTRDICEGAMVAAEEIDANLFILPGGVIDVDYVDEDLDAYRHQYNVLYSYASSKSFDAVVIEYGTITSMLSEERKKEFLKQFGDVPIILIAGEEEGFSSICIDNKNGIHEAVVHMIEEHNCSRIGFVSGPRTNLDAHERLQAYLETMKEFGLEISEQRITYGDFSEYCDDMIEEFILNNPDMEAIVFANDQMLLSGYKAMERLHLQPGKDILMTGFDDSSYAMMYKPYMTTVKVEPKEMSYYAVKECLNILNGKEVHRNVKSRLVIRESCGCKDGDVVERAVHGMMHEMQDDLVNKFAERLFGQYLNIYYDESRRLKIRGIMETYFTYFFRLVNQDGTLYLNEDEFVREYRKYMQICQEGYINLKQFLLVDRILYQYTSRRLKHEKEKLQLFEKISAVREELVEYFSSRVMAVAETSKVLKGLFTNITSDMICNIDEEKKSYKTVIEKLQKMEFPSSCILRYEDGIKKCEEGNWRIPETLCVKAYHDGQRVQLYQKSEKEVTVDDVFSEHCISMTRRYNMLVLPLFTNTTQYGLFLIETESERFQHAIQIACQVSLSLDIMEISKKQLEIKKELEKNLEKTIENNRVLDEMSRIDPMTGILNRRGFLDYIKRMIRDTKNHGKKAIAVYVDMDSLKIINDEFGHDEGDYSLKLIATALSESFRQSDAVARMGGDEFAAFAIVSQENFADTIRERICATLAELNEGNGKSYYVNVSVGIAEFVIDASISIEHVLTQADQNLYREKKRKRKVIYKDK